MIQALPEPVRYDEVAQMALADLEARICHLEGTTFSSVDKVSHVRDNQLGPLAETFTSLPDSSTHVINIKTFGSVSIELLVQNLMKKTYFLEDPRVRPEAIFPFQFFPRTLHIAYEYALLSQPKIITGELPFAASLPSNIEIIKHGPYLDVVKTLEDESERELNIHYYVSGLPHILEVSWSTSTEIATPLCDFDLHGAIHEGKSTLTPKDAPSILRGILEGIAALHTHQIVHCDLKESNIFLKREPEGSYTVKIGDFGLSSLAGTVEGPCGTFEFLAPECAHDPRLGPPIHRPTIPARDIWMVGIILLRLTTGRNLFKEQGDKSLDIILKTREADQHSVDARIDAKVDKVFGSPQLKDLLKKMLRVNPAERITAADALTHPYLAP